MALLFFIITLCYVVLEFLFNINLINIVSSDNMMLYKHLDTVSNVLVVFGACVLSIKLLSIAFDDSNRSFIIGFFVVGLTSFGAYHLPDTLTQKIIDDTSFETKQAVAKANIQQKGLSLTNIPFFGFDKSKLDSADQKALISFIPVVGFGEAQDFILDEKTSKLSYNMIYQADLEKHSDFYIEQHERITNNLYKMANLYPNKATSFNGDGTARTLWQDVVQKRVDFINDKHKYRLLRKDMIKTIKYENNFNNIYDAFYEVTRCETEACLSEKSTQIQDLNFHSNVDYSYEITVENSCVRHDVSNNDKLNPNYNQLNFKPNTPYAPRKAYNNSIGLNCNVDVTGWEKEAFDYKNEEFYTAHGLTFLRFENNISFLQSGDLEKIIISEMFMQGYELPKQWRYTDKKAFFDLVISQDRAEHLEAHNEYMMDTYGFTLPLNLDMFEVLNHPAIKKSGDHGEMGFHWIMGSSTHKKHYNSKRYLKDLKLKVDNQSGVYYTKMLNDDKEYIEQSFKETVRTMVMIGLSTLLLSLNIIAILVAAIHNYFNKKSSLSKTKKTIIDIGFFALFLVLIGLTPNDAAEQRAYAVLSAEMEHSHFAADIYYHWLLNVATLIQKAGVFIPDGFLDIILKLFTV